MRRSLLPLLASLPWLAVGTPYRDFNSYWYELGYYGAFPSQSYQTVDAVSPLLNVVQSSPQCSNDSVLLTPRGNSVPNPGPLILDASGNLIWIEKKFGEVMDMKVQTYRGQDYLTFWSGTDDGTHGRGKYYMASLTHHPNPAVADFAQLDSSYETQYVLDAVGDDLDGDLHEFRITENGTALMTVYEIIPMDLSGVGGRSDGWVYDGLFQEVDIETGKLLFQWRASEHYSVEESLKPLYGQGEASDVAWDYFHINSIDKDTSGNYYISSRYTHTVTCISPNGTVLWTLGGKRQQFKDLSGGAATNFSWQHHVEWHPGNLITIFDNGAYDRHFYTAEYSRGLAVQLDLENMTANLTHSYDQPEGNLAHSQGSVQILPNGNVFVGWGHSAAYTEYSEDAEVLCNVHFGSPVFFDWGWVKSYRTFRSRWVGRPKTPPDIAIRWNKLFVSWNGATEVAEWSLQAANSVTQGGLVTDFQEVKTIPKKEFEASFALDSVKKPYVRVAALDGNGTILDYSGIMARKSRQYVSSRHSYTTLPTALLHDQLISQFG